jgi:endonuclease YncB( thermonuclease family)
MSAHVLRTFVISLLTLVAAPVVASAQAADRAPCVPGASQPICHVWTGKVVRVADGDSFDVKLDGAAKPVPIRLTGVQAMELKVYRRIAREGDCWSVEAAERAESLIKAGGWRVRLTAQHPSSASGAGEGGRNRLRRSVAVKIGGQWVDVGSKLIEEGLALPFPAHPEDHWNGRYQTLAQEAARAQRNIWGAPRCTPTPPANVRVWVNYDADSNDGQNLNDEWIRIKNLDPVNPLDLSGWFVRDSDLRRKRKDDPTKNPGYTLPAGTVVPAGGAITVHVGTGSNTATDLYWGQKAPVFENTDKGVQPGDGAYLFDPSGNLRAWLMYPCRIACSDPLQGKVKLEVDHSSKVESFSVTNVSGEPVDLEGYHMHSYPRRYHFPAGTILQPGEKLTVEIGSGQDTPLHKYWTVPMPFFKNNGPDPATIETYDGIRIDCFAWGRGSC